MNTYWILQFFTKFISINFSIWRFTRNNEELVKAKIDVFAGIVTAFVGLYEQNTCNYLSLHLCDIYELV